jgi:glycerol uptake facilitator-like aquaporin
MNWTAFLAVVGTGSISVSLVMGINADIEHNSFTSTKIAFGMGVLLLAIAAGIGSK